MIADGRFPTADVRRGIDGSMLIPDALPFRLTQVRDRRTMIH